MSFVDLRQLNTRRAWTLVGEAGTGKSTFTTQLRGPLLVIDADGRYQEVEHHHSGAVYALSDRPADYHDPLRIAQILDENMPDAEVGTIVLDSMTAILSPIVTRILEELERGYHKNRAAAWKPKATTVRLIQDALSKWGTSFQPSRWNCPVTQLPLRQRWPASEPRAWLPRWTAACSLSPARRHRTL